MFSTGTVVLHAVRADRATFASAAFIMMNVLIASGFQSRTPAIVKVRSPAWAVREEAEAVVDKKVEDRTRSVADKHPTALIE